MYILSEITKIERLYSDYLRKSGETTSFTIVMKGKDLSELRVAFNVFLMLLLQLHLPHVELLLLLNILYNLSNRRVFCIALSSSKKESQNETKKERYVILIYSLVGGSYF